MKWMQANGIEIEPRDMSTDHLKNALDLLFRNLRTKMLSAAVRELEQGRVDAARNIGALANDAQYIRASIIRRRPVAAAMEAEYVKRVDDAPSAYARNIAALYTRPWDHL